MRNSPSTRESILGPRVGASLEGQSHCVKYSTCSCSASSPTTRRDSSHLTDHKPSHHGSERCMLPVHANSTRKSVISLGLLRKPNLGGLNRKSHTRVKCFHLIAGTFPYSRFWKSPTRSSSGSFTIIYAERSIYTLKTRPWLSMTRSSSASRRSASTPTTPDSLPFLTRASRATVLSPWG